MASDLVQMIDGSKVEVPSRVSLAIDDADRTYILLASEASSHISDNVLCYDEHGVFLWRIEDLIPDNNATFGTGRIRTDGGVEFWNTDGLWILVDTDTGNGIRFRWDRFGPGGESPTDTFEAIHWR